MSNVFSPASRSLIVACLAIAGIATDAFGRELWCERLDDVPSPVANRLGELAEKVVGDSPRPVAELRTEGLLPGQGLHDVSQLAKKDFQKALALAYSWRTTGARQHLASAHRFVLAWARAYRPNFNPIDETEFSQFFEAYAVVRPSLPQRDRMLVDQWGRLFVDGYVREVHRRASGPDAQITNWQSHRIKIAVAAAVAVGELAALKELEPAYMSQLKANIRDDGSTEDFHKRDSLSYATYSLQPLMETALIARAAGSDWVSPGSEARTRLSKALDWMVPYARGDKLHVEFKNSSIRFDRVRAEAGVKGHGVAPWKPANARDLFWLASYFDSKYTAVARALASRPSSYLSACRGAPPSENSTR
jgi:hypothetical protein